MRNRTRAFVVTALLALLVAAAGCSGAGDQAPADAPPADSLQDNVTAAMEDVETATFTMNMSMDTANQDQSISMNGNGAMDVPNRKMRMDLRMQAGQSLEVTQYVVGDTVYMNAGGEWITQNMTGQNIWEQNTNQLAMQQQVMENASVEVTGSATVDGNDVWVVSVQPDPEDIRALVSQQTTQSMPENVDFQNLTVTQYVDAETSHVRKLEMSVTMTVQGEEATMDMTMTFDSFNEPVTIELPAEARNG
jgi:D-alanyl-D-alanine dipeptidase